MRKDLLQGVFSGGKNCLTLLETSLITCCATRSLDAANASTLAFQRGGGMAHFLPSPHYWAEL